MGGRRRRRRKGGRTYLGFSRGAPGAVEFDLGVGDFPHRPKEIAEFLLRRVGGWMAGWVACRSRYLDSIGQVAH